MPPLKENVLHGDSDGDGDGGGDIDSDGDGDGDGDGDSDGEKMKMNIILKFHHIKMMYKTDIIRGYESLVTKRVHQ